MDILSDVLRLVELRGVLYFTHGFNDSWGLDMGHSPQAKYYVVLKGKALLTINDYQAEVSAGEMVIFPHGSPHKIGDLVGKVFESGNEVISQIILGSPVFDMDQGQTVIACGHIEMDRNIDHPLISELPYYLLLPNTSSSYLSLFIEECIRNERGSEYLVSSLTEACFAESVRNYITEHSETPYISALHDERLVKVLHLMHREFFKDWNTVELAEEIGLSRSQFSRIFHEKVGETPFKYLTLWRMIHAARLLNRSRLSVDSIGERIGYSNVVSFNRIFADYFGDTPTRFRKENQQID